MYTSIDLNENEKNWMQLMESQLFVVTEQTCEIEQHPKQSIASIRVALAHTPIVSHNFDFLWFSMATADADVAEALVGAAISFCRRFYDVAPFCSTDDFMSTRVFFVRKKPFSWWFRLPMLEIVLVLFGKLNHFVLQAEWGLLAKCRYEK